MSGRLPTHVAHCRCGAVEAGVWDAPLAARHARAWHPGPAGSSLRPPVGRLVILTQASGLDTRVKPAYDAESDEHSV